MAISKHLSLDERINISQALNNNYSFKEIGRLIDRDCTTISKEVRLHKVLKKESPRYIVYNNCRNRFSCKHMHLCSQMQCPTPKKASHCKNCRMCNSLCKDYEPDHCDMLDKPPYVCNGCKKRHSTCTLLKSLYIPSIAQSSYESLRSESRQGISLSLEEIDYLDKLISPLLMKGQSIHHVMVNHKNEILISESTIYKIIDLGLLSARNHNLPRKVRYYVKKKRNTFKIDKKCRQGRTYTAFLDFINTNPDTPIVEMDSVEGKKGGKVLLTIHFVKAEFMLAFIRDHNDAKSVIDIFNHLYSLLGHDLFTTMFPLIKTDNGTEFSNPMAIEATEDGVIRTYIYYCDPSSPNQKGSAEVNHEFIRRFIPKGHSFDNLSQADISLMMDHINSVYRASLGDKTAFEMMEFLYGANVLKLLGCHKINPDEVTLNPSIFKTSEVAGI